MIPNMEKTLTTNNREQTKQLGEKLSHLFEPGDVILLKGDLGAGKTCFTSGVAQGLGVEEVVLSPTFNIMKCYFQGRIPLYHIDAYRLEDQNIEIGLDEYIEGDGVCLIEWPQFIESLIPDEYLEIVIKNLGGDERSLSFIPHGKHFESIVDSL